jgi:multidrug efflux pump subunit AcrA (membrane-fusion protein)
VITKALGEASTGRATPIDIVAPESGIIRALSALPGQNVPAGGALLEIVGLSEIWVRVPVYVGDVDSIAADEPAAIGPLNMRAGASTWPGRIVVAPPSANALASTVDFYYSVDNSEAMLRPGQRVGSTLMLVGTKESLTVPWSAVVHDIHGGDWVYVVAGERKYRRERVVVDRVVGRDAVLARGPGAGTEVVADGAIELFGAETGFSK